MIPWLDLHVEVDWLETGWDTAYDLIADTLSFSTSRGIASNPLEGFVASAGTATVRLRNVDGDYSADNPDGPYYGYLTGKKPIRFRLEIPSLSSFDQVFWAGRVDKIRASGQVGAAPTVTLSCVGNFIRLADGRKVTPVSNPGDTTDVLLAALLDAAGIASGEQDLAVGEIVSGIWAPVDVGPLEEARRIVATELGRFYEAADGSFTFENRHYRRDTSRSNSVQLTLSDDPGDSDDYRYRKIDESDPQENQYDRIVIDFTPSYTVDGSPVRIFAVGSTGLGSIVIPPGGSKTVSINPFVYPFLSSQFTDLSQATGQYIVTAWQAPTVSGGSPDILVTDSPGVYAAQSSLSISGIVTTPRIITFTLSNSDPTLSINVAFISLYGERGVNGSPVRQVVGAGFREYPLPGPYYPEAGSAVTAARWLYDYWSPPRKLLTLELAGLRSAVLLKALMQREISDRVAVVGNSRLNPLSLDAEFFWEGVGWNFAQNGPTAEVTCTPWLSACLPNTHDTSDDTGLPTGSLLYYPCNESTGSNVDVISGENLTRHGNVSAVGIIGPGQQFVSAHPDYADNAISGGVLDSTMAADWEWDGWIKRGADAGSEEVIFQKDHGATPAYGLRLHRVDATHYYAQAFVNDGSEHQATSGALIQQDVWYFVRVTHNATDKTISVSVNLTTESLATVGYSGSIATDDTGLVFGGDGSGGGSGAAPVFDAAGAANGTSGTTATFGHTCTGSDLLLLVATTVPTAQTISSVTYNGVPLTQVSGGYKDLSGQVALELWYLVAPDAGLHNVIVTRSSGVGTYAYSSASYTGVDQGTPLGTLVQAFTPASTDPSVTFTAATGRLGLAAIGWSQDTGFTTITPGSGETQDAGTESGATAGHRGVVIMEKAGTTSTTIAPNLTPNQNWIAFGIALRSSGGGTTSTVNYNGVVDEWLYAGRILTDAEGAERYNNGAGTTYTGSGGTAFTPPTPSTPSTPIPFGGTAARPTTGGTTGQLYFNTDSETLEYWDGSAWQPAAPAVADYILKSIGTTKGDLIAFSASATPVRKAAGTDGYFLRPKAANSDGLEWYDHEGAADPHPGYTTAAELAAAIAAIPGSGGAVDLITGHTTNEIKAWPPMLANDIDLDAQLHWWRKVGTPSTAPTYVDVAGESITQTYRDCIKVVAAASADGMKQTYTYADEPRLKSGRTVSVLLAIWSVSSVSVTAKLVNSDATHTDASAVTAAAWTIVKIEGHVLAGTSCDLQITAGGSGTFYVVPLGLRVGAFAMSLPPRPTRFVEKYVSSVVSGVDPGGSYNDADFTSNSSPLAFKLSITAHYFNNTTLAVDLKVRRKGDTTDDISLAMVRNTAINTAFAVGHKELLCDDGQVVQYKGGAIGDTEQAYLHLAGYWEWA